MRVASLVLGLAGFVLPVAACGGSSSSFTSGSGAAGATSNAGSSGEAGRADAGSGGLATGGRSGTAGSGGGGSSVGGSGGGGSGGGGSGVGGSGVGGSVCGPCLGIACLQGVQVSVAPDAASGALTLSNLSVTSPGLEFRCTASAGVSCSWSCQAAQAIPNGDHTLTISAPGFATKLLTFTAAPPTNCGCCGCCVSYQYSAALEPTGTSPAGCCADLQSDPTNCGSCGHACIAGATCQAGKCGSTLTACLSEGGGFTNCEGYCKSIGTECSNSCVGNVGAAEWVGNAGCSGSYTTRSCADAFSTSASSAGVPSYACCCG